MLGIDAKDCFKRTLWTCGTFAVADLAAPLLFEKYQVPSAFAFGFFQGLSSQVLFSNRYIESMVEKLVGKEEDQKKSAKPIYTALKLIIKVAHFLLLSIGPIWIGRQLTFRVGGRISNLNAAKLGAYHYGMGLLVMAYRNSSLRRPSGEKPQES